MNKLVTFAIILVALILSFSAGYIYHNQAAAPLGTEPTTIEGQGETVAPTVVTARGTEPFWAFTFTDGSLTWSQPGDEEVVEEVLSATYVQQGTGFVLQGTGITATFLESQCSDGMSDLDYTHKVLVQKGYELWAGCAVLE
jgi:uncharacterized membrane protein